MASFALNYYFSDFNAFGFKTTNLLIHLGNAVVLWYLTQRLLNRLHLNSTKKKHENTVYILALAIASLWAVHPLNLTSVLYVVQRMTSLATLFMLLGLLGYVIGRDRLVRGKQSGLFVAVASLIVFGSLAVFTKEIGVLLPLYALVIEVTFYKFSAAEPFKNHIKRWWIFFGVAVAAVAAIKFHQILGLFGYEFRDFTLTQRLLTEARALWFYIKLTFFPDIRDMGTYHDDFGLSHSLLDPPLTIFAVIGVLLLFALAVSCYRRLPILSFGVAWFLVGHSLESTALPLELVHEHRNYLPQYGLIFAFAYYVLISHTQLRSTNWLRRAFMALLFLLCSGVTFARASDWKDEWTLYSRNVINHPNSASARTMLGIILHDNGHAEAAQKQFEAAAALEPTDSKPMLRLVQQTYAIQHAVPAKMLDELEYRLRTYSFSAVTLWTFEPLLKNTVANKQLNLRLIHMYEQLLSRTDISLPKPWRENGLQTIGFAYRETGNYHMALYYFQQARELVDSPTNQLLEASMQLKLGHPQQAKALVNAVLPQSAKLNEEDSARLRTAQTALDRLEKTILKK